VGKTTTKEMVSCVLAEKYETAYTKGNFNNHIGLPMTILNCPRDAEFLVLEMGTNHPGEIAALCSIAEPDAALITNIGNAHLEFFGSQEAIAREKGSLFASLRPGAVAAAGADNRFLDVLRSMCPSSVTEADVGQDWIRDQLQGVLPGDILVKANNQPLYSPDTLQEMIDTCPIGQLVTIDVSRKGRTFTVYFTPGV
jgi:UDP-N-acetylmuramoyl-tripeptide--D-alanyl-D-alanine ligase